MTITLVYKNLGMEEDVQTTQLNTANSAWFNKDIAIHQEFVDALKMYYDADTMNVDFTDETTKDAINAWIEEKTNGLLKDTIDETKAEDLAFLINTLYFKGTWIDEFDAANTVKETFHVDQTNEVLVDMMKGSFDKQYYEDNNCQIVALNYYDATMYVVLPKGGLTEFLNSADFENLDAKISEMNEANVEISFPKFKYNNSTSLNDYLKQLGIEKIFDPMEAELEKITDSDAYVSNIFQNATIEVDEEGTEAAAVTVVHFELTSMPMPLDEKVFNCDHPFLYVIKDNKTGINLFMGVVSDPAA